jgi:hypothetical protein
MSRYIFQFFVLTIGAILTALWEARRNRNRPAQIKNGFHVVRCSLGLRLLGAAFLIAMLTACTYLLWLHLATDEKRLDVLWFLVAPLLAFAVWAALTFRVRNEYNETTLIAYDMFGEPRQFALSDLTMAGPVSWRGHEYSTEAGDKIYVNTYQTGAPDLIDLLQRRVKQTYFE